MALTGWWFGLPVQETRKLGPRHSERGKPVCPLSCGSWGHRLAEALCVSLSGLYLLIAVWHLGAGRALAFLVLGYLISWAAEFCSIHFGFPFGEYLYIPATLDRELWVAGVPFMDSLSYVFLAYASYSLALLALTPGRWEGRRFFLEDGPVLGSWRPPSWGRPHGDPGYRHRPPGPPGLPLVFGGRFTATRAPGLYFGIPLSNFAGWLVVSLGLIRLLQILPACLPQGGLWDWGRRGFPGQALLGPGLYLGILGFNLAMTLWIGERTIFLAGVFIYLPFFTWLVLKVWPEGSG